ncbi:hypothetical protein [Xenorhabdus thuongxuanensis]|uniref:Peptidase M10 metallopeptidase domain-containing protein n=1 Tax=Xenorhabdus thuongxuanensis TaxID=1873484 RepID=A0A1Q5TP01_9GAMM|nr:hypothetical protein [Xenorhabdus thuongxuanensis]OKP01963.1 hypothetical protein Xentx_03301 [Xenorhabdus thuongxuanensis]
MYKNFFKPLKVFNLLSFILLTATIHGYAQPSHFDPSDPTYNHISFFIEEETLHTNTPLPYSATYHYGPFMRYYIDPQITMRFNIEGGESEDILLEPLVDEAATYWNEILRSQGLTIAPLSSGGGFPNFIIRTVPNSYFYDSNMQDSIAITYEAGYSELRYLVRHYSFITSPGIYIRQSVEITRAQLQQLETNFGTNDRRVLLENFTYSFLLHEFGHAVGLSHPITNSVSFHPPPRERWHIANELGVASLETLQDNPQPSLMESYQFGFLQALYLYNRRQYQHLARHMIHLSEGERHWIRAMVSCTRRYEPDPPRGKRELNSNVNNQTCSKFVFLNRKYTRRTT